MDTRQTYKTTVVNIDNPSNYRVGLTRVVDIIKAIEVLKAEICTMNIKEEFMEKRLFELERAKRMLLIGIALIVIIVLTFLCASQANATPNPAFYSPIEVIHLKGPYAVNEAQAMEIVQLANQMLSTAFPGGLGAFYTLNDKYRRLHTIGTSLQKATKYSAYFRKTKPYNKNTRHYIMAPPMIDNGLIGYIGGWSKTCQYFRKPRYSYGNAIWKNRYTGDSRKIHSAIIMAHEIGHQMGMHHDGSGCTIMNPAAASCSGGKLLTFSEKSKRQARNCYGRQIVNSK